MDLRDDADEAAFRAEVRGWLRDNLPVSRPTATPHVGRWDLDLTREWTRRVFDAGYAGLTWPREYGGAGRPLSHHAIYLEEAARAGAPDHIGVIGLGMAGPTIIARGTSDQKATYLPRILSGESVFCQGFSEPSSGSDLASLRTSAVRHGDTFVLNGQKVWSSFAHVADRCILLARTNPGAPPRQGLTFFLMDMHAPGVTVRRLRQMTGESEFSEIFLDNVHVPESDVVGGVDDGWSVAITTLMHERSTLVVGLTARLTQAFDRLLTTVRERGFTADPLIRDRLAALWIDIQAVRFTNYRKLSDTPGADGSVGKLRWSEAHQRLTTLALEVLGPDAQLDGIDGFWGGYWQYQQLRSRANTIEAGTSEILRSVIAERVLGLPRSR